VLTVRCAIVIVSLLAAGPALAESDAARRLVTSKLFGFNCFDGSRGTGRVYDDGSVIGAVQFQNSGAVLPIWLPAGTLTVKSEAVTGSFEIVWHFWRGRRATRASSRGRLRLQ
jgi:hypothetical protein